MRTLGNIIWHIPFLGFLTALFTFLLGSLLVLTVIGAPLGLGLIQLSKFLLSPFTSSMVDKKNLNLKQNKFWKSYGVIIRIIYFPFGLGLAIITIFQIVFLFLSIIGIPIAVILSKSLSTYFNPVNKISVPRAVGREIENQSIMGKTGQKGQGNAGGWPSTSGNKSGGGRSNNSSGGGKASNSGAKGGKK